MIGGNGLLGILIGKAVAAATDGEFRARKRVKVGPKYLNLSWTKRKGDEDRGFLRSLLPRLTSQGYEVGPVSYNETHGTTSVDTPGTGSVRYRRRGRGRS